MLRWCSGATTVAPALAPQAPRAPRIRRRHRLLLLRPCGAKKSASDEEQAGGGVLSRSVLLRAGVALFALGFVDAGYSGDWSRIGAISKDTEEILKLGAYVVVPLALFLIVSVSDDNKES